MRVSKLWFWGCVVLDDVVFGDVGIALGRWSLPCHKAESQQRLGLEETGTPAALERKGAECGINPAGTPESRCHPSLIYLFSWLCVRSSGAHRELAVHAEVELVPRV